MKTVNFTVKSPITIGFDGLAAILTETIPQQKVFRQCIIAGSYQIRVYLQAPIIVKELRNTASAPHMVNYHCVLPYSATNRGLDFVIPLVQLAFSRKDKPSRFRMLQNICQVRHTALPATDCAFYVVLLPRFDVSHSVTSPCMYFLP